MNKTSTAKTVCPYFCSDGRGFIRCEFGKRKITLRCARGEKTKKQTEHCFTFAYPACDVAKFNDGFWEKEDGAAARRRGE